MYDAFSWDIEIIIRNVFDELLELVATAVSSKNVQIWRVFSLSAFLLLQGSVPWLEQEKEQEYIRFSPLCEFALHW